jgi:hypothetical protein
MVLIAAALTACVAYGALRFVYLLSRPSLGIVRGSASEADSRSSGFYLGAYTPTRRVLSLRDLSVIHVPDAWVERAWKPELTFLLQDRKISTDGYYLYIPIHPDDSTASKTIWPFKFSLKLDQNGQQISRYPGIGYEPRLGFCVFLDYLPESLEFIIEQKEHENDSWNDAVRVETIEFKRAF